MKHVVSLLFVLFSLTACSGPSRPEIEQANIDFQKLYPEAEIIQTRITEDEVIARSFEFTYRKRGETEIKKIEIQYLDDDSGPYKIAPKHPKELP